jgi:glyceraldehyde 3-phosphate dehydrogenase
LSQQHKVISIGSCTTNALAPVAHALHSSIGIELGYMTTIHAYTNDQNLTDNSHKDLRRARAAALSMIPSSTGAAKAIGKVIPDLAGKLSGSAIRVPVPNVSMIDLSFVAARNTTKEEVNEIIRSASENELNGILTVAKEPLVSIDFNHNPSSSIFDPFETHVISGKFVRVVAWYDNEWGFVNRLIDIARLVSFL